MIILITIGAFLAFACGLAVIGGLRNRKSGLGRVDGIRIDAEKANALIPPAFGRGVSEYLPPPDDGRPQH